jgi:hypothetical protein
VLSKEVTGRLCRQLEVSAVFESGGDTAYKRLSFCNRLQEIRDNERQICAISCCVSACRDVQREQSKSKRQRCGIPKPFGKRPETIGLAIGHFVHARMKVGDKDSETTYDPEMMNRI